MEWSRFYNSLTLCAFGSDAIDPKTRLVDTSYYFSRWRMTKLHVRRHRGPSRNPEYWVLVKEGSFIQ
jgi:hypothetical protein